MDRLIIVAMRATKPKLIFIFAKVFTGPIAAVWEIPLYYAVCASVSKFLTKFFGPLGPFILKIALIGGCPPIALAVTAIVQFKIKKFLKIIIKEYIKTLPENLKEAKLAPLTVTAPVAALAGQVAGAGTLKAGALGAGALKAGALGAAGLGTAGLGAATIGAGTIGAGTLGAATLGAGALGTAAVAGTGAVAGM